MRMTATLQAPRINVAGFIKLMTAEFTDALTQGAFEWIQAATAEIPVWSGASHATFLKLSREIGFSLSIDTASNAPRRVSLGQRQSDGSFEVNAAKGTFFFSYETTLAHLIYNEFNNANTNPDPGLFASLLNPGPYDFQGHARDAYLRSVRNVSLPDVRDFVKVRVRQVR